MSDHINKAVLLRWQFIHRAPFAWLAPPCAEVFIDRGEEPVIGIKWTGRDSLAFTASEKLFLPDPVITGEVGTITITRNDLRNATRVPRDPENDIDDIYYFPDGDFDISCSQFSTVIRAR